MSTYTTEAGVTFTVRVVQSLGVTIQTLTAIRAVRVDTCLQAVTTDTSSLFTLVHVHLTPASLPPLLTHTPRYRVTVCAASIALALLAAVLTIRQALARSATRAVLIELKASVAGALEAPDRVVALLGTDSRLALVFVITQRLVGWVDDVARKTEALRGGVVDHLAALTAVGCSARGNSLLLLAARVVRHIQCIAVLTAAVVAADDVGTNLCAVRRLLHAFVDVLARSPIKVRTKTLPTRTQIAALCVHALLLAHVV